MMMKNLSLLVAFLVFVSINFTSCDKNEPTQEPTNTYKPNENPTVDPDYICNGHPDLCDKRYDEIVYITTHKSYSYAEGPRPFNNPYQPFTINQQLKDGVRGLWLDIHSSNSTTTGTATVFDGSNSGGEEALENVFKEIRIFLDNNDNEVITLFIDPFVTSEIIDLTLVQADLKRYLHIQQTDQEWPLLRDMIAADKRLVIFSFVDESPNWMHYAWDYMSATSDDVANTVDFSCQIINGIDERDLYMVNHFISEDVHQGNSLDKASTVNRNPFLISRLLGCIDDNQKTPNFLVVDHYNVGDVFTVVDIINEVDRTGITNGPTNEPTLIHNVIPGRPIRQDFSVDNK